MAYETTTVPVERSQGEVRKLLTRRVELAGPLVPLLNAGPS